MNAVVDTIVHMDTFRNIDLFFQGVYYFQLTLSHQNTNALCYYH